MNLSLTSLLSWMYLLIAHPNRVKALKWLIAIMKNSQAIVEFVLPDGSRFKYPLNSAIGRALCFGVDGFENNEVQFILNTLEEKDIFFDIGANGGFFTVMAAKKVGSDGHVYAFEPSERERNILNENIKLNNLSNVTVINTAVGDKNKLVEFILAKDGALNSLFKNKHPTQIVDSSTHVEMITIDSFVASSNISDIKLIKIDVEGAEKMVFEGAMNTLLKIRPKVIFESSDLTFYPFGYSTKDLFELVVSSGMTINRFTESSSVGEIQIFNYREENPIRPGNFVALAKSN
jgi:FkbM family methyltransferase